MKGGLAVVVLAIFGNLRIGAVSATATFFHGLPGGQSTVGSMAFHRCPQLHATPTARRRMTFATYPSRRAQCPARSASSVRPSLQGGLHTNL